MLYRRFFIVASLIALFVGVGMANLVRYTKEQRDVAREYPGLVISNTVSCRPQNICQALVTGSPFRV